MYCPTNNDLEDYLFLAFKLLTVIYLLSKQRFRYLSVFSPRSVLKSLSNT